ncbi:MAG: hypothetical protein HC804_15155 [Anaerolineae bacterium]|nr:hypothetical protein [Anaerolineae bacterium]
MQGNRKGNVRFWVVMLALLGLSTAYDLLIIRRMDKQRMMERWTWATVVVGVAYTLAAVALLDWRAARLVLVAFMFSGTPMSIGDLVRYLERKTEGDRVLNAVVRSKRT